MMIKKIGVAFCVTTTLFALVASVIFISRDRSRPPQTRHDTPGSLPPSPLSAFPFSDSPVLPSPRPPSPPFVPAPVERVSAAMDETIVRTLILQARTASLKGDAATTGALVKGLKTHRATSEKLLAAEIASAPDPTTKQHLEHILAMLSGEPK